MDYWAGFARLAADTAVRAGEGLRRWETSHGEEHPLPDDRLPACRFLADLREFVMRGGAMPSVDDYEEIEGC